MKVIAYSRPDGGVSVVNPAPGRVAGLVAGGMTEDEAIAVIQAKSVPGDATQVEVMDRPLIPTSRVFRNAWTKSGGGPPVVDMPKARVIKTEQIRRERDKRLKAEDVETMKAIQNPAQLNVIEARKRTLRDIPATIQPELDTITTPEALEAYQPAWP